MSYAKCQMHIELAQILLYKFSFVNELSIQWVLCNCQEGLLPVCQAFSGRKTPGTMYSGQDVINISAGSWHRGPDQAAKTYMVLTPPCLRTLPPHQPHQHQVGLY